MLKKKSHIASTPKRSKKRSSITLKSFIKKVRLLSASRGAFFQSYFWHFSSRLTIIAFFIGFNISLGKAFLDQNELKVPAPIATLLLQYGIIPGDTVIFEQLTNTYATEIKLEADDIILELNAKRELENLLPMTANAQLASAAAVLLDQLAQADFDLQSDFEGQPLSEVIEEAGYSYAWIHHNALVGPLSPEAVITAWLSDDAQSEAVFAPEFIDIGIATKVVETSFMGKAGVVVQLLAQPQVVSKKLPSSLVIPKKESVKQSPLLAEFSDQAVLQALNDYRATHGVHSLQVNSDLCTYAQKRTNDLVAYGSLDNHAGFIADFDREDPPVGISSYGGGTIGENLASQYCINGTTGESIFAEHPIQLIEWCFDSSVKGHREAQLSTEYRDVCVRHKENMYVVIFGRR